MTKFIAAVLLSIVAASANAQTSTARQVRDFLSAIDSTKVVAVSGSVNYFKSGRSNDHIHGFGFSTMTTSSPTLAQVAVTEQALYVLKCNPSTSLCNEVVRRVELSAIQSVDDSFRKRNVQGIDIQVADGSWFAVTGGLGALDSIGLALPN